MISNDVFTATSFTTSTLGNTLSVTGYNAATGVVSYSYTLLDNETHAAGAGTNSLPENLAVVLTDQDNQTASDTLVATSSTTSRRRWPTLTAWWRARRGRRPATC